MVKPIKKRTRTFQINQQCTENSSQGNQSERNWDENLNKSKNTLYRIKINEGNTIKRKSIGPPPNKLK